MLGGSPLIRKSSNVTVAFMIVSSALARIQSSLGKVLDWLVFQMSLATLPLKLTIILSIYYTMWDSVISLTIYRNGVKVYSINSFVTEDDCILVA